MFIVRREAVRLNSGDNHVRVLAGRCTLFLVGDASLIARFAVSTMPPLPRDAGA